MKKYLVLLVAVLILSSCTDPLDLDDNVGKYNISENVDETDDMSAVQWDDRIIKHLAVGNEWEYEYTKYNEYGNTILESGKYSIKIFADTVIAGDTFYIQNNNNTKITCEINLSDGLYVWDKFFSDPESAAILKYKYPIKTDASFSVNDTLITLIDKERIVELDFGIFECYLYRKTFTADHFVDIYMKPGMGLVKEEEYLRSKYETNDIQRSVTLTAFNINSDTTQTNK